MKRIVRHVPHISETAPAVEKLLEAGLNAGPDFDSGEVARVGHGDVVDEEVFDDVGEIGVLSQGANRDSVGADAV